MDNPDEGKELRVTYEESYAESAKGIKPFAWAIGGSTAAIIFGFLYLAQLFSDGLAQARLYDQMIAEVETETPIKEKLLLPALSKLLNPSDGRIQRVADVIYLSEQGQYEKALQRLKSPSFPVLEANDEMEEALSNILAPPEGAKPESVAASPEVNTAEEGASADAAESDSEPESATDDPKREIWAYGNAMVKELARPKISDRVRKVYKMVVSHTKAKGYSFPPLP